jgi:hypothetical protein
MDGITAVIKEVRGGYGGTLVCDPAGSVVDSPAFVAHYLRAFSGLRREDCSSYDYRFERLLSRLSEFPDAMVDPRLDWDVMRAFLEYERGYNGEHEYRESDSIHRLESAKDLLWCYLGGNGEAIRGTPERLTFWVDHLAGGLEKPGHYPLRPWYILLLISQTDTETGRSVQSDWPFPWWPQSPSMIVGPDSDTGPELPAGFAPALSKLASHLGLGYECWGIHPSTLPNAKAVRANLSGRMTCLELAWALDQESWSREPHFYRVSQWRPIGRRASYWNVSIPPRSSDDGVFLFRYGRRIYAWMKADMESGTVRMLLESRLIDEARYGRFLSEGLKPLPVTVESN